MLIQCQVSYASQYDLKVACVVILVRAALSFNWQFCELSTIWKYAVRQR